MLTIAILTQQTQLTPYKISQRLSESHKRLMTDQGMKWGCISWFGSGTVTAVSGNIKSIKYQDILEDHLWPVVA